MATALATPGPGKIKVLAKQTLIFMEGAGTAARKLQVESKPGIQEVDAWIMATPSFVAGLKSGVIVVVSGKSTLQPANAPPTIEDVMTARGCSPEEAQKIVDLETVKFNQGEYPYPPKVKVVNIEPAGAVPTVASLMAAGCTQAQAEAALAIPASPAPVAESAPSDPPADPAGADPGSDPADSPAPKTNGNGKKNGGSK